MNHNFELSIETQESLYPLNVKLDIKARNRKECDDDSAIRHAFIQDLTEVLIFESGIEFDGMYTNREVYGTSEFIRNHLRIQLLNSFADSIQNTVLSGMDNKTLTSYSFI